MLVSLLLQAILAYGAWRILRIIFKHFVLKSPLDDLPGPPSHSLLLGNIPQFFNAKAWGFHREILKQYGRVIKIRGALGERLLVITDPRALHHILIKDQAVYERSKIVTSRARAFFGKGITAVDGEMHRKQRKMLNPVFSINHMREMIPIFYEVTERLRTLLKKKVANGPQEIDLLHWTTRTALELIGQSGMGYSFDPLVDDQDYHPYSRSVKRLTLLVGGTLGFFVGQFLLPLAAKFKFPRLKRYIAELIPTQRVRDLTNVVDTMHRTSLEIIQANKEAMASAHPDMVAEMASKKDIISILMRANASASEEDRLSEEELVGQISTLVFAAMDTTSSALARIFHLLATHQDVQEKLRQEIKEAERNGQLSHDQLVYLPYLDSVCRETLRVYPPLNVAAVRTAEKDMILPFSRPIQGSSGKTLTEVFVQKGTNIIISILGANCDPDLWGPDSFEWKPERWLSPIPKAVEEAHMPGAYSHIMTFLGGGRGCIGFKFSQLEMKVVLSTLLTSFKFSLSDKEISWQPSGITGPVVKGPDGIRQQLPLIMSRID